jgi:uroporphyrinogen-III synthase
VSALEGRRIVVTRAPHQAAELETLLRERGAAPLLYPCIDIAPPEDATELDRAIQNVADGAFDWLVLTSANTVTVLTSRIQALGIDKPFAGLMVAAVGPATADAARERLSVQVSAVPDEYLAEALAAAIQPLDGARVLLPRSAVADRALIDLLAQRGATVTHIEAYRTVIGSGGVDLPGLLRERAVDAITLASASAAANLLIRLDDAEMSDLARVHVFCIGPKTAQAARTLGLPNVTAASEHTLTGLMDAMAAVFERVQE